MLADPLHINANAAGMSAILSAIGGGADPTPVRLQRGIYQVSHFSFDHCLPEVLSFPDEVGKRSGSWLRYPHLGPVAHSTGLGDLYEFGCYGVCDSPEQFLEHAIGKWIVEAEKYYVVSFSKVVKANQSSDGGWRWHKWGEYIGVHEPKYEYIYNEGDEIQEVHCYHVFECLSENAIAPIEEN